MSKKIFILIKRPDACFYYRILSPYQQLSRQFGYEIKYTPIDPLSSDVNQGVPPTQNLQDLIDCHGDWVEWADVIEMQRPTCHHHLEFMRWIQKDKKKPVIFSADDNYLDVPSHNTGYEYFKPRSGYIKSMIEECDVLTVTTEALADIYRKYRRDKSIYVCPNSIDFEALDSADTRMMKYEQMDRRKYFMAMKQMGSKAAIDLGYDSELRESVSMQLRKKNQEFNDQTFNEILDQDKDVRFIISDEKYDSETNGKQMIAWSGSPTHKLDLEVITNPIKKIMDEKKDLLLGMGGFIHSSWFSLMDCNRVWLFGLVPVKYYYSYLKQINGTVMLSPVNKDDFNVGKSNLKSLEAMALGKYTIASDFVTYEGLAPEVPLCQTDDDWYREIKKALEDEDMRFEVEQSNRKFVEENYDIKKNVKHWKDAIDYLTGDEND